MKKRTVLTLVISILVLTSLTIIFSKALFGEKAVEIMEYLVGKEDVLPEFADANGDASRILVHGRYGVRAFQGR